MTPEQFAEFRCLLDALCEEIITPEQVRRLEELVLTHPEAEARYVQCVQMLAELSRHFGQPARSPKDTPHSDCQVTPESARVPTRLRRLGWGAAGFLALAACLFLSLTLRQEPVVTPFSPAHAEKEEACDDTVAVLLHAPRAEWEKTELPTAVGSPLRAGVLKLKSGVAQLEFYGGATVILEGPAELHLLSRTEAFCARGKLLATVPPQAHGFKIGSPKLNLVDRGTEFGFVVGDRTEVHVFQGKVELYDAEAGQPAGILKELSTGQSVRLEKAGVVSSIEPNPGAFLRTDEFAARCQEEIQQRQLAWLAASDALRKDPALELYFRFWDGQSDRKVSDLSGRNEPSRDGTVVGCNWISGRWPGRKALEFKQVSDRVRFRVSGEFKSLTLMAWVRVDALSNVYNSLMMCDGREPGEFRWEIHSGGKIYFDLQSDPKGRGGLYTAKDAVPRTLFGQWIHLAVVYNRDEGHVTHFVNGKQAAQVPILFDVPLRISNAEIGNWNTASYKNSSPVRFFTGGIDEFMVFSRPFKADEIDRVYTQSKLQ